MSNDYWKHDLRFDDDIGQVYAVPDRTGEAFFRQVSWSNDGLADVAGAHEHPNGAGPAAVIPRERDEESYWRGFYQMQNASEMSEGHHAGSVSVRARRAYAAEALRQKDHVAAGLLAIFLGVFGVHKFYLGCNQTAFLMLAVSVIGGIFTLGLAAAVIEVIAIIEGVIYLSRSQTEFDRIYVLNQRDWF